jgi:uncharacterized membrane protein
MEFEQLKQSDRPEIRAQGEFLEALMPAVSSLNAKLAHLEADGIAAILASAMVTLEHFAFQEQVGNRHVCPVCTIRALAAMADIVRQAISGAIQVTILGAADVKVGDACGTKH